MKLQGTDLINKLKEMDGADRADQAKACGYIKTDGRADFTALFEALSEAHSYKPSPIEEEEEFPY